MPDLSRLHGVFPPILTPLTPDERLDAPSLRRLLDFLIDAGVHGIWLLGTTGEFACLPAEVRDEAVRVTLEHVANRVPVVVNVSDASTALALRHARQAVRSGATYLAATPPYYFPDSMDEVLSHYRALKDTLPDAAWLIYNIPQTTKVPMSVPAAFELAQDGTASGIKDSQNNLVWYRSLAGKVHAAGLGERFRMFIGTPALADVSLQAGGHGAVLGVANVAPTACVASYDAMQRGDYAVAARAQEMVARFEELSSVAQGGSTWAASFSAMKQVLQDWGVLEHATVTQPLRPLAAPEVAELRQRVSALPRAGRLEVAAAR